MPTAFGSCQGLWRSPPELLLHPLTCACADHLPRALEQSDQVSWLDEGTLTRHMAADWCRLQSGKGRAAVISNWRDTEPACLKMAAVTDRSANAELVKEYDVYMHGLKRNLAGQQMPQLLAAGHVERLHMHESPIAHALTKLPERSLGTCTCMFPQDAIRVSNLFMACLTYRPCHAA